MNSERLTQGSAYCGVPAYDNLTAYVTRTYQSEWRDIHGNLWRKTCTVINLGRADAVTPADPGAELAPASLSDLPGAKVRRNAVGYTLNRYVDVVRRYGPLPILRIAELTGQTTQSVTTIIKHNAATFIKVGETQGGRGKMAALWGLKGVHDGEAA